MQIFIIECSVTFSYISLKKLYFISMRKLSVVLVVCVLFFSINAEAQKPVDSLRLKAIGISDSIKGGKPSESVENKSDDITKKYIRKTNGCISGVKTSKLVYAELGGPGLISVNYDMRFKGDKGWGFRAGFGGFVVDRIGVYGFPLGLNYLIGNNKKHYLEVGAGATPLFSTGLISFGDIDQKQMVAWHALAGYRLQFKNGINIRATYSPMFGDGLSEFLYGGISLGYRF